MDECIAFCSNGGVWCNGATHFVSSRESSQPFFLLTCAYRWFIVVHSKVRHHLPTPYSKPEALAGDGRALAQPTNVNAGWVFV